MIGGTPNWFFGQQNAGLGIYVSTCIVDGVPFNGQFVAVPPNATTQVWVTGSGGIQTGSTIPVGAHPIATVVSGQVLVGGNLPAGLITPLGKWAGLSFADGILSITDIRQ